MPSPTTLRAVATVGVALPFLVVTAPVWLPGVALRDALTGRRRFPTVRLGLFGLVYLAHDWVGVARAVQFTLTGRGRDHDAHAAMQAWWIRSLFDWAERLLDVRIDVPDLDLPDERVILVSRHASMVDAALPAFWINAVAERPIHYVLKAELRIDPSLDLYGRRLGNYFVDRDGDAEEEAHAIAELGRAARPRSATAIFPEGTYATAESRRRVRASLERRGADDAVALLDEMDVLLPPKPAGTLALLEAMPDAPVVVVGHVGLEGVAELSGLRRHLPLRRPVDVTAWLVPRHEIPDGEDERVEWLNEQWRRLDEWVARRLAERGSDFAPVPTDGAHR